MTTWRAADGSISITSAQAARALDLYEHLLERPETEERKALEAKLSPALVLGINMGVALGKALELEEQEALNLFRTNPYFQRLVETMLYAYYEDAIVNRLLEAAKRYKATLS